MSAKLSDFGEAKTEMLSIYAEMCAFVSQIVAEVEQMTQLKQQMNEGLKSELLSCLQRIEAICPMLQRKRMKVAFFGRTSNGKSSVINAMLHERVLPSAMGHTTSCFCQVEATLKGETAHVMLDESEDQKLSIDCLRDLASAHSNQALGPQRLLHVRWPSGSRCTLLQHDVELLDTPGVDVTAQLDECIDRHCHNADVFVLVLNAESTMARVERQFFEAVARQLLRPNLFILNNRWDVAATLEPHMEQLVRAQHTQRCLQLLTDELGIYTDLELARSRIYHVSALETLRLRQAEGVEAFLATGARQRYEEFQRFEREFASCLTQTALSSKLSQHCVGAAELLLQLHALLQELSGDLSELVAAKSDTQTQLRERLSRWELQMTQQRSTLNVQLEQLSAQTAQLATQLLHAQIQRLPAAVQHFKLHFQPLEVAAYKRALATHLEQLLWQQLETQLAEMLQQQLPQDAPWQLYCCLDCQQLMADFQLDLQFRFSWGMAAIMQRLRGKLLLPLQAAPKTLNGFCKQSLKLMPQAEDEDGSLGGMLLLGGILARSLNWRLLLVCGSIVCGIYVYELVSWTQPAQERSFKSHYTRHLQHRLRETLPQAAAGLGQQVRQQLQRSMRESDSKTQQNRSELNAELVTLATQLQELEMWHGKVEQLQQTLRQLQQRITQFQALYLPVETL